MTLDEAIARCVASGRSAHDCAALAHDHMVDGVYCDGTIVIGPDGKRCVSRELADRVAAARADQPLRRDVDMVRPSETALGERWLALGLAAFVAIVVVWSVREKGR